MRMQYQKHVCSIGAIFLALVCFIAACHPQTPQVIERDFSTMDLLITAADMPEGWKVSKEPHDSTSIYEVESSSVSFIAEADTSPGNCCALLYIDMYGDIDEASHIFDVHFYPSTSEPLPVEWQPFNTNANQFDFICVNRPEPQFPDCTWAAQYQEYIVVFSPTMIPGFMSLDDMGKVVQAIDARMVRYLGEQEP